MPSFMMPIDSRVNTFRTASDYCGVYQGLFSDNNLPAGG